MSAAKNDIEIISAPSILGLKPTGVEKLADTLLEAGLAEELMVSHPVAYVPTLNHTYKYDRDPGTNVLNAHSLRAFSLLLINTISASINRKHFPVVLGGDCSILVGIMPALKESGNYGLIFMDAHADFYSPEKSITGKAADMDLALVTGRGPDLLTNINNLKPYVKEENVIHIGQRDWEETKKYNSPDIRESAIKCISLAEIDQIRISKVMDNILHQ